MCNYVLFINNIQLLCHDWIVKRCFFKKKCNKKKGNVSLKQILNIFLILTKTNINTLLTLCQEGNQMAQMEVYNRYAKAMYNTAYRIVHHSAEAEDVMQEAFITAFNKLDTFKGTATFGAWLKRIVINASIAKYKKNKFILSIDDTTISLPETDYSTNTNEDYTDKKIKELMTVLQALKPSYRTIITLHYIEGYDYEELSEILNMSYGNCRTMLSRAKESLRKKLKANHYNENR